MFLTTGAPCSPSFLQLSRTAPRMLSFPSSSFPFPALLLLLPLRECRLREGGGVFSLRFQRGRGRRRRGKKEKGRSVGWEGGEDWRGVGCALPPPRPAEATGEEKLERNGGKKRRDLLFLFLPFLGAKGGGERGRGTGRDTALAQDSLSLPPLFSSSERSAINSKERRGEDLPSSTSHFALRKSYQESPSLLLPSLGPNRNGEGRRALHPQLHLN